MDLKFREEYSMKKILTALFALTILVGCSSAEYTTNDLNLEVGLTEEELISEIKETIKVDEEKASEEQLEDIEISFDESKLKELGEFIVTIKVDNQELTSKVTLSDTTKPTIKTANSAKVEYNTKIDNAKLIELFKIELSDNFTSKEKLLEFFAFSNYDKTTSGKQEITLTLKDENGNETKKNVTIEVGEKPTAPNTNVNNTSSTQNTSGVGGTYTGGGSFHNGATQTPAPQPQGQMVWISATGSKYHAINNCGRMNPNTASYVTINEAINMGLSPCSKCF